MFNISKYRIIIATMNTDKELREYMTILFENTRKDAEAKNIPFEITVDDLIELYKEQQGKCALTGQTMTFEREADKKGESNNNATCD